MFFLKYFLSDVMIIFPFNSLDELSEFKVLILKPKQTKDRMKVYDIVISFRSTASVFFSLNKTNIFCLVLHTC